MSYSDPDGGSDDEFFLHPSGRPFQEENCNGLNCGFNNNNLDDYPTIGVDGSEIGDNFSDADLGTHAQGPKTFLGRQREKIGRRIHSTTSATLNTAGGILKTAGTATSEYILAPTASLVAKDVLPELFALIYNYVKAITPQRGR